MQTASDPLFIKTALVIVGVVFVLSLFSLDSYSKQYPIEAYTTLQPTQPTQPQVI